MSGMTDRSAALLQELQQNHYTASHASDGSRGDWDKPKSKQEMEQLHNLYHKIDALETELAGLKEEVECSNAFLPSKRLMGKATRICGRNWMKSNT